MHIQTNRKQDDVISTLLFFKIRKGAPEEIGNKNGIKEGRQYEQQEAY
jgi:hypothetical protein